MDLVIKDRADKNIGHNLRSHHTRIKFFLVSKNQDRQPGFGRKVAHIQGAKKSKTGVYFST